MCCCVWQSRICFGFFFLIFAPKVGQMGQKQGFRIYWKFSHYFFLNLVFKKSSYYLLYSCTNPILEKNLLPEIWAKMLLANHITGFLNWLNLQNTKMKKPHEKAWWKNLKLVEKYWSGHGQKWVWKLWSKDTKIGCISKRNKYNKLVFGVLIKIQESLKLL